MIQKFWRGFRTRQEVYEWLQNEYKQKKKEMKEKEEKKRKQREIDLKDKIANKSEISGKKEPVEEKIVESKQPDAIKTENNFILNEDEFISSLSSKPTNQQQPKPQDTQPKSSFVGILGKDLLASSG